MKPPGRPPLVTVVTPAFDVEPYLAAACESVLCQTDGRFEHLIVDNASTDGTRAVAESFAARDERVRVLDEPRRGSSQARNRAIAEARGTYIAFLDGDDVWHPRFLERMITILRARADVGLAFSGYREIDERGTPTGVVVTSKTGDYDLSRQLVEGCAPGSGSTVVVRRSCFQEAGRFDEDLTSAVDYEMWLRIGTRSRTPLLHGTGEVLADYRRRSNSITSRTSDRIHSLEQILATYAGGLSPRQRGLAYLLPALNAYETRELAAAARMTRRAREAGIATLLRTEHGPRLLAWSVLHPVLARRRPAPIG